jgi:hypothetical protein
MIVVSVLCALGFLLGVIAIGVPNWATFDGNPEGVGLVDPSDPVCAAEEVINVVFSMTFILKILSLWSSFLFRFEIITAIDVYGLVNSIISFTSSVETLLETESGLMCLAIFDNF